MTIKPPGKPGINSGGTTQLRLPANNEFFKPKNVETPSAFGTWQQSQSPSDKTNLMRSLDPAIRSATRKYVGSDDPVAVGQAKILVLKALPRFDPNKSKIETFVDRQLQPLIRWQSRRSRSVKMPDQALMDLQRLTNASRELSNELGREPDTIELADHTGLSRKRIAQLRQASASVVPSSMEVPSADGTASYAEDFAVQGGNFNAWARMVRDDLAGPDRFILEHTLGLDGSPQLSNTELARKLKMTPGAISQRKAKVQQLLDMQSELSPFYG